MSICAALWGNGHRAHASSLIHSSKMAFFFFFFFKQVFFRFRLFIFKERGREGEREGEKHQCVVASRAPSTGYLAWNPGMCPHWESNQQPFGSQASTQSAELHQPGPSSKSKDILLTWLVLRSHCWSLPEPSVTWGRGKYLIYTFKRSLQWLWTEKMQGRGEGATGR